MSVKGYDLFSPLVDFWQWTLSEPEVLARRVRNYYPMEKRRFYELQKQYLALNDSLERAAVFFALNRSSFSGTTLSGGMSPGHKRFTDSAIERLRLFHADKVQVEHKDYRQSIAENSDSFLYLAPPYLNGQKLYGLRGDTHEGFDHKTLRDLLDTRGNWILSYNDCPTIRNWYSNYRILRTDWQYGMANGKESNEVLVLSDDIP